MSHLTKRGTIIPLETLLGILIALLVFGTLWYGVSRFFRLSEQAENNFDDLADTIIEVGKQTGEPPEKFISIQDKGTFLVLMNSASSPVVIDHVEYYDNLARVGEQRYVFAYPVDRCGGETCLCLCQKYELANPIRCSQVNCRKFGDLPISEEWANIRHENNLRRVPLQIENVNSRIRLTGGNEPQPRPINQASLTT